MLIVPKWLDTDFKYGIYAQRNVPTWPLK